MLTINATIKVSIDQYHYFTAVTINIRHSIVTKVISRVLGVLLLIIMAVTILL
jgi:hypothetical protein